MNQRSAVTTTLLQGDTLPRLLRKTAAVKAVFLLMRMKLYFNPTLFAVWIVLSTGLASLPTFELLNRPWPGYIGLLITVGWFCASAWFLLGITPKRVMRHFRNRR